MKLRQFLTKQTTIKEIIDFGELPVFSEAATFPSILLIENNIVGQQNVLVSKIKSLKFNSLIDVINDLSYYVCENSLSVEGWSLAKNQIATIVEKLQKKAVFLSEYVNNQIYLGIKTGCNEAFVIDKNIKEYLVKTDPNNQQFIKSLIVGDDLRKYEIKNRDLYLLLIPWGWTKQKIDTDQEKLAWNYLSSLYPSLTKHLEGFAEKARKRCDQGQFWWELRSCTYYDIFEKPKIIYPDIAKESRFTLDNNGFYSINTTYLIPSQSYYLLALLNSSLIFFYMSQNSAVLGDTEKQGRLRFFGQYMENIPIRKISFSTKSDRRQQSLEKLIKSYRSFKMF